MTAWRAWLAAGACGCLLLGCNRSAVKPGPPPDPLLTSKKPVARRADKPDPAVLAHREPAAPAAPETALASVPPKVPTAEPAGPTPCQPVPVRTAVRSSPSPQADAAPAVRRTVSGNYGHAPDYSWLQGVLDRHYHGHWNLRYCDPTADDAWGGKVCLEDDPRLGQFKEGDVVRVEGDIVRREDGAARGTWNHFPKYRLRDIRRVSSAE